MPKFRILLVVFFLNLVSIEFSTSLAIESQNKDDSSSQRRQNEPETSTQETDIVRLTEDIKPISYELWVVPDLDKFIFSGTVKINIRTEVETDRIILHSKKLKINKVQVLLTETAADIGKSYELDQFNDLLIIKTSQQLIHKTDYKIVIDFQGVLEENSGGFYRSYYTVGRTTRWLAITQFEPNHAREAFPCFDDPRFRSSFTIYTARDKNGGSAVSNMPIRRTLPSDSVTGPNRVWDEFRTSNPIPTNLVSYMIARDFLSISSNDGFIRIRLKRTNMQVLYILHQSQRIYQQLKKYITNVEHNLPKLDIVAVPYVATNSSVAVNWGMVNVQERFVILEQDKSSARHLQEVTQLTSRGFAQQLFGDLVTPAWYDNEWLKEGFGVYFGTFLAAEVEPSWNLDQIFAIETIQESLWREVTVPRAITTPIQKSNQVTEVFDIISGNKAGAYIRMLEHVLTSDVLKKALRVFLQNGHKIQNGIVNEKNLLDAVDSVSSQETTNLPPHISVSDAVKTWTKNIGFPLLNVIRNYSEKKVTVTQTPYRALKAPTQLPDQQWIVPLTYTTKSEANFSNTRPITWIYTNEPVQLEKSVANADWILFNLQHSGYYRVNYDIDNWNLLIDQLQQDHTKIDVLNRAQLIDDAFALAYDEHLSYRVPFKLAEYLLKETDMTAWYSGVKALDILRRELQGSSNYENFQTYLRKLVKDAMEIFEFYIKSTDDHLERIVKPLFLMLACEVGDEYCIERSLVQYDINSANLDDVDPDLKDVVFCHALVNSKNQRNVFDNLWYTFKKSKIPYERTRILSAIACASDERIIRQVLMKITNPNKREVLKQEIPSFVDLLVERPTGVTAVIKFIVGRIEKINQLDDNMIVFLKYLLRSLENNIKNQDQRDQLNDLESKVKSLDQKKYGEFTSIVKHLQSTSEKTIKYNAQKLDRIKNESA